MSRSSRVAAIIGVVALALTAVLAAAVERPRPSVLARVMDVPIPGAPSRFDYQSLDTTSNLLYVSHMGAGRLLVFDVAAGKLRGEVEDLPRITGVLVVPALGKVFASVPGRHEVEVIDAATRRAVSRLGPIGFPDGIAYAPTQRKLYVSDESGGGELVIDAVTNRVMTRVPLGGEAGNTIFDPGSGRVLVAVQTRNQLVEIDPATDRIAARHVLPGSAHPHGMSLDSEHRLLFVASEENASLVTVDLRTMRVLERHGVAEEPDVLAFDASWKRLYVAAESGAVGVFEERERRLVPQGQVVIPHAHTVAVDPRTHLVYLPLADVGGRSMLRVMRPRPPSVR